MGSTLPLRRLSEGDRHYFVVEIGSERGKDVLSGVTHRPAEKEEVERAAGVSRHAEAVMGRTLETKNLARILHDNFEHPRWDDVAKRCLSVRELHDGLSDVLLLDRGRRDGPDRRPRRTVAPVGFLLHGGFHARGGREHPDVHPHTLQTMADTQTVELG